MKDRSSQNSTNPKPPFGYRIGRRIRSVGEFSRDAVRAPKTLPGKAHGLFRRWFQKVWRVRGGGLYACGYALTFLYFEARTLAGEVSESTGVQDFFRTQMAEFFIRFAADTIGNMIKAFIWPVYIIELHPIYGGVGLGLTFLVFARFLKKPIEAWLFADDDAQQH